MNIFYPNASIFMALLMFNDEFILLAHKNLIPNQSNSKSRKIDAFEHIMLCMCLISSDDNNIIRLILLHMRCFL